MWLIAPIVVVLGFFALRWVWRAAVWTAEDIFGRDEE
jgi:hypothetical protein